MATVQKKHPSQYAEYKVIRLNEMAAAWKGTVLDKHEYKVPLLAMILIENGALDETVRGDHGYAIGLEQNHLCTRGFTASDFSTKRYCGARAEQRFAEDIKGTRWAGYLTDWRTQFMHYTETVKGMADAGKNADQIIKSWNSREVGRRAKVQKREGFVMSSLGIL